MRAMVMGMEAIIVAATTMRGNIRMVGLTRKYPGTGTGMGMSTDMSTDMSSNTGMLTDRGRRTIMHTGLNMNMTMDMNPAMGTVMVMVSNTGMPTDTLTSMPMNLDINTEADMHTDTSMDTVTTMTASAATPTVPAMTADTAMHAKPGMGMPTATEPRPAARATATELIALLHLASPALPIGAYSYSQGLEAAIEAGLIGNAGDAARWIAAGMEIAADGEGVLLAAQYRHWCANDVSALAQTNAWLLAMRESAELRLESEQMGWSMAKLLADLEWGPAWTHAALARMQPLSLPTVFACAASGAGAGLTDALSAWLFAWVENQVSAALKAVPLGQVAGQRILFGLHGAIANAARRAAATPPEHANTFAPMLGILSARHETQYSRLFRS